MTQKPAAALVEAQGIIRNFQTDSGPIQILHGIDLSIFPEEFVALRGRSGSGKTTLLNILVGLDDPTQGQVHVIGQNMATLNEAKRAAMRRENIGLLFQNAHLFAALTAIENVEVALRLLEVAPAERTQRALAALELVGLGMRAHHRAMELSGGEQQRVALARALVHKPRFIVADEPTGNLDSVTGQAIIKLLHTIMQKTQVGLLVATHDAQVINSADRVLQINDGQILKP